MTKAIAVIAVVLGVLLVFSESAAIDKRAARQRAREMIDACSDSTPCGWEVYHPVSRRTNYRIRNTCECPSNARCRMAFDDVSISAYVYLCNSASSANSDVVENRL